MTAQRNICSVVLHDTALNPKTGKHRSAEYHVNLHFLGNNQFQVEIEWGAIGSNLKPVPEPVCNGIGAARAVYEKCVEKKTKGNYVRVSGDESVPQSVINSWGAGGTGTSVASGSSSAAKKVASTSTNASKQVGAKAKAIEPVASILISIPLIVQESVLIAAVGEEVYDE
jgi:hypothetical protein